MAKFRSELHVPVQRDDMNFQDRQMKVWEDTEVKMEKRRREWDEEFDRMRGDFFTLRPNESQSLVKSPGRTIQTMQSMFEDDAMGHQRFKVRFEVSEFKPEEIQVKVQDNKLVIYARHEEKGPTSSISREYSRQVDIPKAVDQERLQCTLSRDGILTVDAPVLNNQLVAKATMLPIQSSTFSPNQLTQARPLDIATPVKNPIVTEPDGSRKLRLSVDVGEFRPDEIVVKTADKKLVVHAEHEEKTTGRTMHKEFNKEYELPDSVDQTAISAYIGDEGKLIIEAPMKTVARKKYHVTQSQDVRKVTVTKESQVTIADSQNRPMVTINVHRH